MTAQTSRVRGMAMHWIAVAATLGLLAAAGVAVHDDYGVWRSDTQQRVLGHAALDHAGNNAAMEDRLGHLFPHLRYYGVALEAPLALIERALGQTDSRAIYLTRHLFTHLAFLVGAGAAALLARRLFGGTWPALLAIAAFALHPRLYAHSFFNTKDAPFAALFMVCLALAERAFRRGTVGAFALLGVGVGVLVNLRVMGALLFAAVLLMLALDVALARGWAARRRVLAASAVFTAAAAVTLYAVSPYLWSDPSRLAVAFAALSQHVAHLPTVFAGTVVRWPNIPAQYVPTWVAITTPPALLALCVIGAVATLAPGRRPGPAAPLPPLLPTRPPGRALANGPRRFGLLLVACPMLAIAVVVAANANVYNGWRHLYFLWAPLAILTVLGLRSLAGASRRRTLRGGLWGLAAAGVAFGAAQLALLHPHQHTYFNLSVDRDAPERLATWHEMFDGRLSHRRALEQALDAYPDATVGTSRATHRFIFPASKRRQLVFGDAAAGADLLLYHRNRLEQSPWIGRFAPNVLAVRVYDNTLAAVIALDVSLLDDALRDAWRAEHRATAASVPAARSDYNLHLASGALTWLRRSCGAADRAGKFASTVWPADGGAATSSACDFVRCGVRIDGACMVRTPLPPGGGVSNGGTGALKAIVAGQQLRNGPDLWRAAIEFRPSGAVATDVTRSFFPSRFPSRFPSFPSRLPSRRSPILPPAAPVPLPAEAPFDLYLDGSTLVYAREACRPEDTRRVFFLHVFPKDPTTLPEEQRKIGFHNLDFRMEEHDEALLTRLGRRCVAWRRLPDGPIARLRTGQLSAINWQLTRHARRSLWSVEFVEPKPRAMP